MGIVINNEDKTIYTLHYMLTVEKMKIVFKNIF